MNILQISRTDDNKLGGGAIITHNLHNYFKKVGYEPKMLVDRKFSTDANIDVISAGGHSFIEKAKRYIRRSVFRTVGSIDWRHYKRTFNIFWLPEFKNADIINLHNLHSDYFDYRVLPELSRRKPVIWSLHDMWALTGYCAYSYDCNRWQSGCYDCPLLKGDNRKLVEPAPVTKYDFSQRIWHSKKKVYNKSKLHIVVGSSWMEEQVKKSILSKAESITKIYDGVDIDTFHPFDKLMARKAIQLPSHLFVILIIAVSGQERKGLKYAISALRKIKYKKDILLLVVGGIGMLSSLESQFNIKEIGRVYSREIMNLCYNASNVLLYPTLADNLPLSLIEALSAGLPSVSFDVGGISEIVQHIKTGILVTLKDVDGLASAIESLRKNKNLIKIMSQESRELAESEFSISLQGERYLSLYETILEKDK